MTLLKHIYSIRTNFSYDNSTHFSQTRAKVVLLDFMNLNKHDENDFTKAVYFSMEMRLVSQGSKRNIPQGKYRILSYYTEEDDNIQGYGLSATLSIVYVY